MSNTKLKIEGVSPEEYASYWGCDGSYDSAPNLRGDGALFYNFSSERQVRDAEYLTNFLGAIDRTIEKVKLAPAVFKKGDLKKLGKLRDHVASLNSPDYQNLDTFTKAYIEAALFAETDNSDDAGGEPLDNNYSYVDIAPTSLAKMAEDCRKFQTDNAALLEAAYPGFRGKGDAVENAGYDFWMTRRGHGVGFWESDDWTINGDELTAAAKSFGDCYIEVGDDGKLYVN